MSRGFPQTVLMTADTVGGVWRYAIDLAAGLAPHGVRVVLATMGRALSDDQWTEAKAVPGLIVEESTFKLEWMPDSAEDVVSAGYWLMALERRYRPDLVHLNGYAHGALMWSAPVLMVAHSCVASWWRAVKGEDPPASDWHGYLTGVRRGLAAADMVVAPTAAYLAEVEAIYGRLSGTRVILNGRDRAGLGPAIRKRPLVLAAGRVWDEAKNLRLLGTVAPVLGYPIHVAGESRGPDGSDVALEGVEVLGRLDAAQMAEAMGRAAVFTSPALYEPFGLAVLEAALSGCALVLSDIPTFRELWEGCALFADPRDPAAWSTTLDRVLRDDHLRIRLAEAARVRAARLTAEAMAAVTLDAYAELRTGDPARPPIWEEAS
ncbi:glycosyltransferase family 4 protein [Phenylobacterium sp.]|uniref:glycosyltransferase family 4 protein n=1 Tax=Phenylobacterium sp. TaxID=1871053 RepID=UPI0025D46932|nr:glycosyltransferase family 4 protein [Phenylobacterium sp.]